MVIYCLFLVANLIFKKLDSSNFLFARKSSTIPPTSSTARNSARSFSDSSTSTSSIRLESKTIKLHFAVGKLEYCCSVFVSISVLVRSISSVYACFFYLLNHCDYCLVIFWCLTVVLVPLYIVFPTGDLTPFGSPLLASRGLRWSGSGHKLL